MILLHIADFNGGRWVKGPNCSFKELYTVPAEELRSYLAKLYFSLKMCIVFTTNACSVLALRRASTASGIT